MADQDNSNLPVQDFEVDEELVPSQHDALVTTVARRNHFPFAELPAELRVMIYEELFAMNGGQLIPRVNRRANLPSGLGILAVSHLMYEEAYAVFVRRHTPNLRLILGSPRYDARFVNAVTNFTRLNIMIMSSWHIDQPDPNLAQRTTARKIERIISLLNQTYTNRHHLPVQLHITFRFEHETFFLRYFSDPKTPLLDPNRSFVPSHPFRAHFMPMLQGACAFLQTQVSLLMDAMRAQVNPGILFTITSNADTPIAGVEVRRVDVDRVNVRIAADRLKGFWELMRRGSRYEPEFEWVNYDDEPL